MLYQTHKLHVLQWNVHNKQKECKGRNCGLFKAPFWTFSRVRETTPPVKIAGNMIFEPGTVEYCSENLSPHRPVKIDCIRVIKYYENQEQLYLIPRIH
jgi:hypothetical protein